MPSRGGGVHPVGVTETDGNETLLTLRSRVATMEDTHRAVLAAAATLEDPTYDAIVVASGLRPTAVRAFGRRAVELGFAAYRLDRKGKPYGLSLTHDGRLLLDVVAGRAFAIAELGRRCRAERPPRPVGTPA